jgi:hypothetical protein
VSIDVRREAPNARRGEGRRKVYLYNCVNSKNYNSYVYLSLVPAAVE